MPRVTIETVEHVARLARLSLTRDECLTFAGQLDEILQHAASIQSLDLADVPPMSHAGSAGALRADTARDANVGSAAFAAAPDASDRLFRVPRILPG
ncbi:MAG: Asp-tRNA(Asn)/Glu-tRNA(Gln) amidotransferase subunit GatC [Vicinamibacteria bacterium]